MADLTMLIVGGTDAPGIMLVPDGHGGYKIVHVPGWNPEQMAELSFAARVVASAARLKNPEVSRGILNSAAKLAASELANVAAKEVGSHPVVVVVG